MCCTLIPPREEKGFSLSLGKVACFKLLFLLFQLPFCESFKFENNCTITTAATKKCHDFNFYILKLLVQGRRRKKTKQELKSLFQFVSNPAITIASHHGSAFHFKVLNFFDFLSFLF
jgi:hypothetical protein